MQTRLDLLTRSLPELSGRDTGAKQVPVIAEGEGSFGNTLTRALNEESDARDKSSDLTQRFAAGENVELHQVMAASEEAGLGARPADRTAQQGRRSLSVRDLHAVLNQNDPSWRLS
jgi:flagellar hook-basal body complex protein FliE